MKKILVIDDDNSIRNSIKEIFEVEGYIVDDAENGLEAIKKTNICVYDLIICDIEMPFVNGYQVIQKLKDNPKYLTVPFIFLTGLSKQEEIIFGLKLGAKDYIVKPFDYNEIVSVVNNKLNEKDKIEKVIFEKNSEVINAMTFAIPHELITPLNGIIGTISLLIKEGGNFNESELNELRNVIYLSSLRLKDTIEKFIIYNELSILNSEDIFLEEVSIEEILNELFDELVVKAKREEDVVLDVSQITILTSRKLFFCVVKELFSNALKFSFNGQKINIESKLSGTEYILTFTDYGIGMNQEQIEKINSFVQFDRKVLEQQGLGLGLFNVKLVCEKLGYKLDFTSHKGEFTSASIYIPL